MLQMERKQFESMCEGMKNLSLFLCHNLATPSNLYSIRQKASISKLKKIIASMLTSFSVPAIMTTVADKSNVM